MVILKFEKTAQSAYVAHVDTLRAVTFAFRRANVSSTYSQGYNPHMELNFSPPIPLGVESLCEYVSLETDDVKLDELNKVCQSGLRFVGKCVVNKVNITSLITHARYIITAKGIGNCADEISKDGYSISYTDKSGVVTKDVSNRIVCANKVDDDNLDVILTTGNENLRPDRLALHLCNVHNIDDYSIVKTDSYVGNVPTDEYLKIQLL